MKQEEREEKVHIGLHGPDYKWRGAGLARFWQNWTTFRGNFRVAKDVHLRHL